MIKTLASILVFVALAINAQTSGSGNIVIGFGPAAVSSSPTFGAEIVRGSDSTASTQFPIAVGALAAGNALIVSINTSATAVTVTGVTDPRGNTYTVNQSAAGACGGAFASAIVSAIITTPLQAGDNLTVNVGSATGTRLYQAVSVSGATAIDITTKSGSCSSTSVSIPASVVANSVQVGFVMNVNNTSPAYASSAWTAVGANQSSGAVGIITYLKNATVGAGTANPNGSFSSNQQWEGMWVSVK
jgi:hypothetical protein